VPRQALGRGLEALIPELGGERRERIVSIDIDAIQPNRHQPRQHLNEEKLQELADSIRSHGLVQPVVVRTVGEGYELVAGERRWRAARLAGLDKIPAVVKDCTEAELLELALIENLQREDLAPLEEAGAYQTLIDQFGLTQEGIAHQVGKSRSQVANTLRLLGLGQVARELLASGALTGGHARTLLGVTEPDRQGALAKIAAEKGLSVRQLEELVRVETLKRPERGAKVAREPWMGEVEEGLGRLLGVRVSLHPTKRGGYLRIRYARREDVERLYAALGSSLPGEPGEGKPGEGEPA